MPKDQERRDEIRRRIKELERGLAEIDLQDNSLDNWNTEREEQLEEELAGLRLQLDKLGSNQDRESVL